MEEEKGKVRGKKRAYTKGQLPFVSHLRWLSGLPHEEGIIPYPQQLCKSELDST